MSHNRNLVPLLKAIRLNDRVDEERLMIEVLGHLWCQYKQSTDRKSFLRRFVLSIRNDLIADCRIDHIVNHVSLTLKGGPKESVISVIPNEILLDIGKYLNSKDALSWCLVNVELFITCYNIGYFRRRRHADDPVLFISRKLMNFLNHQIYCRSSLDIQLRDKVVVDVITDDRDDYADPDIPIYVHSIMSEQKIRSRLDHWCSEVQQLTWMDGSMAIQHYFPLSVFVRGLSRFSWVSRRMSFQQHSLDVLLRRMSSISSLGDIDNVHISRRRSYYPLLFEVLAGKFESLTLKNCKFIINDDADLNHLFHPKLHRLELLESSTILITQSYKMTNAASGLKFIKVEQYNLFDRAYYRLDRTIKSLSRHLCLKFIEDLHVILWPSCLGHRKSSLICDKGWLLYVLDDKRSQVQMENLVRVLINVSIKDSHDLREFIDEILGLCAIKSYHHGIESMEFSINLANYKVHRELNFVFEMDKEESYQREALMNVQISKSESVSTHAVNNVVTWLKSFHIYRNDLPNDTITLKFHS